MVHINCNFHCFNGFVLGGAEGSGAEGSGKNDHKFRFLENIRLYEQSLNNFIMC